MGKRCTLLSICLMIFYAASCAFTQQDVPASKIKVGKAAPDFELMSTSGKTIKLSSFKGKENVLLAFYPKAGTMG